MVNQKPDVRRYVERTERGLKEWVETAKLYNPHFDRIWDRPTFYAFYMPNIGDAGYYHSDKLYSKREIRKLKSLAKRGDIVDLHLYRVTEGLTLEELPSISRKLRSLFSRE